MVDINENILSKKNLIYGTIQMPKGFDIKTGVLQKDILTHNIQDCNFPFSIELDKLQTYLREHIKLLYNFTLIQMETTGYMFKPNESNIPNLEVNQLDLRNSPDYVMLYGVNVENSSVKIYYNDNRRAGKSWDIKLENNKFIMFPSTLVYHISNKQNNRLNFILKTNYEFI